MSRNRGKRNVRDEIAKRMSEKMHISNSVAISMFPYLEIMFQNDELAWEISDFLGFDFEEDEKLIKRFRSRKIPKKVMTKMEKRKAQMHVEERDRRAEELKNQMMNVIPEEASGDEELPFEIPGLDETPTEEVVEEPEIVEEEAPKEEKVEEKKDKKADKQTTLFSF
jgi:replication factor C large subunit